MPDELQELREKAKRTASAIRKRFSAYFARWWKHVTKLSITQPMRGFVTLAVSELALLAVIGIVIFGIAPKATVSAASACYALSAIAQSVAALGALTFTALFIALQLFQGRYGTPIAPFLIRDPKLRMTVVCVLLGILMPIIMIISIGDKTARMGLVTAGLLAGVAAIGATVWYVSWRIQRVNAESILEECGQQIDALAEYIEKSKNPEQTEQIIQNFIGEIEQLGNIAIEREMPHLLGDICGWLDERYHNLRDVGAPTEVADMPLNTEERLLLKAAPDYSKFADHLYLPLCLTAMGFCIKADDKNWRRILHWFERMAHAQDRTEDLRRTFDTLRVTLDFFGRKIVSILTKVASPDCATEPVLSDGAFKAVARTIHSTGIALVRREYFDELNLWMPKLFDEMLPFDMYQIRGLQRADTWCKDGQRQSVYGYPMASLAAQERMLEYFAGALYAIAIDMLHTQAPIKCMISYLQHVVAAVIVNWKRKQVIEMRVFLEEVLLFFRDDGNDPHIKFYTTRPERHFATRAGSFVASILWPKTAQWHLMLWSYLQLKYPFNFDAREICVPLHNMVADMAPVFEDEYNKIQDEMWQAIEEAAEYENATGHGQAAKQAAWTVVKKYKTAKARYDAGETGRYQRRGDDHERTRKQRARFGAGVWRDGRRMRHDPAARWRPLRKRYLFSGWRKHQCIQRRWRRRN